MIFTNGGCHGQPESSRATRVLLYKPYTDTGKLEDSLIRATIFCWVSYH